LSYYNFKQSNLHSRPRPSRARRWLRRYVDTLADRLLARSASLIFKDAPGVASDMKVAALVIRKLVAELRATHDHLTETLLSIQLD